MIGGQRFHALDRIHNQLGHRGVVVIPARMVVFANGFWQLWIRDLGAVELPVEDDQNCVPASGDVLLRICLV
jgi:hypothetical protein